jgi:mono/diheme cytochrome c family protein
MIKKKVGRGKYLFLFISSALLIAFQLLFSTATTLGKVKKETRIVGQAVSANGAPLTGIIAVETGRLYSKEYRYGGFIDRKGKFAVVLPSGGDYGVHIYATGHIYFPVGVKIKEGKDNVFNFRSPPNQAIKDAPRLSNVTYERPGKKGSPTVFKITAKDPNNILSYQVVGVNVKTGEAFRLSPPESVYPWTKNYPQGVYKLTYNGKGRPLDPHEWYFLAANNRCYTSNILGFPFNEKGVLKVDLSAPPVRIAGELQKGHSMGRAGLGKKVFNDNCAICHYSDSGKMKVGPGLKGLFKNQLTPARMLPVTEETIRKQILKGGIAMPPYSHIEGEELESLIDYLKTL